MATPAFVTTDPTETLGRKSGVAKRPGSLYQSGWTQGLTPGYDENGISNAPSAAPFDMTGYKSRLTQASNDQSAAIDKIFGAKKTAGLQDINDIFGKQRGDTIEEQGALGNRLLTRSGQSAISNVDAQKNKAAANFITGLEGDYGTAQAGASKDLLDKIFAGESTAASLGLQQQQLTQQERQFAQQMGLSEEQFAELKRKNQIDEQLQQLGIKTAGEVGKAQANANQPQTTDYVNTLANLIGAGSKFLI